MTGIGGIAYYIISLIGVSPVSETSLTASPADSMLGDTMPSVKVQVVRPSEKVVAEKDGHSYFLVNAGFGSNGLMIFNEAMGYDIYPSKDKNLKVSPIAGLDIRSNDDGDDVNVFAGVNVDYNKVGGSFNTLVGRGSFHDGDTSLVQRTDRDITPGRRTLRDIVEQTISKQDKDIHRRFLGFGFNSDAGKQVLNFGAGFEGKDEDVKDLTYNQYREILTDSMSEYQGSIRVDTKTNLITDVSSNARSIIENKFRKNSFLVEGAYNLGIIRPGMAFYLFNGQNKSRVRTSTNNRTDINGNVIVTIYGNNVIIDTIPVSSSQEDARNFLVTDFADNDASIVNPSIKYGKADGVNGVFDFWAGIFNSSLIGAGNRINFPINDKIVNSLDFHIDDTKVGVSIRLDLSLIPSDLIKTDAYNPSIHAARLYDELRAIDRRVDLADKQKTILKNNSLVKYARKSYGPWLAFNFDKTYGSPNQVVWGVELGYNALDWFNISTGFSHNSFKNLNEILASVMFSNALGINAKYGSSSEGKEFSIGLLHNLD